MEKSERLQLAIAQAEIVVRLLAEGQEAADVSNNCDIPLEIVKAVEVRLRKAEEDGFDKNTIASLLSALIKR